MAIIFPSSVFFFFSFYSQKYFTFQFHSSDSYTFVDFHISILSKTHCSSSLLSLDKYPGMSSKEKHLGIGQPGEFGAMKTCTWMLAPVPTLDQYLDAGSSAYTGPVTEHLCFYFSICKVEIIMAPVLQGCCGD